MGSEMTDGVRSIAEMVRHHAEEATTAVVDGITVDAVRAAINASGDFELVAEIDATVDADTRKVLELLVESADCRNRIADIALACRGCTPQL